VRLFVTGTDTGVGKTTVSVAIARRARQLGLRVFACKPIETGCGDLGDDQEALAVAAGNWQRGPERGLYRFPLPAAPLVADPDGTIDVDRVVAATRRTDVGLVLVEGAGGWRVPITPTVGMSQLAQKLGDPVLVVARAGLGTINHSLLTLEAIERDGCQVAALVLSQRPEDDADFTRSNQEQIGRLWKGPIYIHETEATWFDSLLSVSRGT